MDSVDRDSILRSEELLAGCEESMFACTIFLGHVPIRNGRKGVIGVLGVGVALAFVKRRVGRMNPVSGNDRTEGWRHFGLTSAPFRPNSGEKQGS